MGRERGDRTRDALKDVSTLVRAALVVAHEAARNGNSKDLKKALDKRGVMGAIERQGASSPLITAAKYGHMTMVKQLMSKYRLPVNCSDPNSGQTALHAAAETQALDLVTLFLSKGANPMARSRDGRYALHSLVEAKYPEEKLPHAYAAIMKMLLAGVDVDCTDHRGRTPLHLAVTCGDTHIAVFLCENGASVHSLNADGHTALHLAAMQGDISMCQLLLGFGADPHVTGRNGSALDFATRLGSEPVIAALSLHSISFQLSHMFLNGSTARELFLGQDSTLLSAVPPLDSSNQSDDNSSVSSDSATLEIILSGEKSLPQIVFEWTSQDRKPFRLRLVENLILLHPAFSSSANFLALLVARFMGREWLARKLGLQTTPKAVVPERLKTARRNISLLLVRWATDYSEFLEDEPALAARLHLFATRLRPSDLDEISAGHLDQLASICHSRFLSGPASSPLGAGGVMTLRSRFAQSPGSAVTGSRALITGPKPCGLLSSAVPLELEEVLARRKYFSSLERALLSPRVNVRLFNPEALALQFRRLSVMLAQQISWKELINCAALTQSSTKGSAETAKPLRAISLYLRWMEDTARWVETEVLIATTPEDRAETIEFFAKVAAESLKLRDDSTCLGLVAALYRPNVVGLHESWGRVRKPARQQLDDAVAYFEVANGFSHYAAGLHRRARLKDDQTVPYLPAIFARVVEWTANNTYAERLRMPTDTSSDVRLRLEPLLEAVDYLRDVYTLMRRLPSTALPAAGEEGWAEFHALVSGPVLDASALEDAAASISETSELPLQLEADDRRQRSAELARAHRLFFGPVLQCDENLLTEIEWKYLMKSAVRIDLDENKLLVDQGQPSTRFYRVLSGSIRKRETLPNGALHMREELKPGQILGELALLDVLSVHSTAAVAAEPSVVLAMPIDEIRDTLSNSPALESRFYWGIALHLAQRLRLEPMTVQYGVVGKKGNSPRNLSGKTTSTKVGKRRGSSNASSSGFSTPSLPPSSLGGVSPPASGSLNQKVPQPSVANPPAVRIHSTPANSSPLAGRRGLSNEPSTPPALLREQRKHHRDRSSSGNASGGESESPNRSRSSSQDSSSATSTGSSVSAFKPKKQKKLRRLYDLPDHEIVYMETMYSHAGQRGWMAISDRSLSMRSVLFGHGKVQHLLWDDVAVITYAAKSSTLHLVLRSSRAVDLHIRHHGERVAELVAETWREALQRRPRSASGASQSPLGSPKMPVNRGRRSSGVSDLDEEGRWRLLLRGARVETFVQGDVIIQEGSSSNAVYQMISGEATLQKASEVSGKAATRLPVVLEEGDVFGEVEFLDHRPAQVSVTALSSEVEVAVLDSSYLAVLFHSHPTLAARFYEYLGQLLGTKLIQSKAAHTMGSNDNLSDSKEVPLSSRIVPGKTYSETRAGFVSVGKYKSSYCILANGILRVYSSSAAEVGSDASFQSAVAMAEATAASPEPSNPAYRLDGTLQINLTLAAASGLGRLMDALDASAAVTLKTTLTLDGARLILYANGSFRLTTPHQSILFRASNLPEPAIEQWLGTLAHATAASIGHDFGSFAPPRDMNMASLYADGEDYFIAAAAAMENARSEIFISSWYLVSEIYLRRGPDATEADRLDQLLLKKAKQGVKIYALLWNEMSLAVKLNSQATLQKLTRAHKNIFVLRHPPINQLQLKWTHHQKLVIVDQDVAFVGGLDICYGRYDTHAHAVTDACALRQTWPGADYTNPLVDTNDRPEVAFRDVLDRMQHPRMPWHDVHSCVQGPAARDVARNFIQRWNHHRGDGDGSVPALRPSDTPLVASGSVATQVVRSLSEWSGANCVECSILNAWRHFIRESQHCLYIEQQFFITDTGGGGVINDLGSELIARIRRALEERAVYRVVVVVPITPDGDFVNAEPPRLIMKWQLQSIARGNRSLLMRVRDMIIEFRQRYPKDEYYEKCLVADFLSFFSLRSYGSLSERMVTSQIYVHSKLLIVDDRTVIIGSANLNDRSMLGSRDSEIALVLQDTALVQIPMNGRLTRVSRLAHDFRVRLWREHLGLPKNSTAVEDPIADSTHRKLLHATARKNTRLFSEAFPAIPKDEIGTISEFVKALNEPIHDNSASILSKVKGHLVYYPTEFLSREELLPGGVVLSMMDRAIFQ